MDKLNFVKDGVTKLPPGFRFQPTDEEIVFEYLARKIFSCPLPASIIPVINVCKYDPWNLPGELEQDRYFFSNKETKYRNGNRTNRATDSGYWKATGLDRQIICSRRKHNIMGMKKTLVFYKGKTTNGSRTDWVMHEYRLVNSVNSDCNSQQTKNSTQNSPIQMGNWALCRIFLKKRNTKNEDEIIQRCKDDRVRSVSVHQPRFYDFLMITEVTDLGPASSSSSSSSSSGSRTITEVSSSGLDHEDISG
ncbi:hypothetical protein F0562_023229 [Nyssa sinensis]|uniref:NAC domain-containing protein n=1 Tax=Nyssa sinensis TaxID=561372 RepID=A0A5J5BJS8_9ASTE|nr:hypothetical protein F0562_023229 [Nyssa sinensis]